MITRHKNRQLREISQRSVRVLFRHFAVEVFVVLFRFGAWMVDNAIPMIRRRTELEWNIAGIDNKEWTTHSDIKLHRCELSGLWQILPRLK